MDLNYAQNLGSGVVEMNIFSPIGDGGINGQAFADEIRFLNEIENVKQINVNINSPGGSVLDGYSIFTAIMKSKAIVNTHVVGIAASIAGVIAQAGKRRTIVDFGRLMLHLPNINGDEEGSDSTQVETLRNMREMIVKTFVNNTFKTTEEVDAILENTTWFNADEAIKAGLADQVVSTHRQLVGASNDIMAVYNMAKEFIENPITKPKSKQMKDVANFLDLDEASNESTILKGVKKISKKLETATNSLETAKNENETLKTRVTELEADAKTASDAAAVEFVENTIKEGKLDEAKKADLLVAAKNDLASFKLLVTSMPAVHADVTNVIKPEATAPTASLREMDKNDPQGLEKIRNDQPELYKKMYKAEYGIELIEA